MSTLKDHEIAALVNDLTKIAQTYGHTQQLRERISQRVNEVLGSSGKTAQAEYLASSCVGKNCSCPHGECAEAKSCPDDLVFAFRNPVATAEVVKVKGLDITAMLSKQAGQELHQDLLEIRRRERPGPDVLNMQLD